MSKEDRLEKRRAKVFAKLDKKGYLDAQTKDLDGQDKWVRVSVSEDGMVRIVQRLGVFKDSIEFPASSVSAFSVSEGLIPRLTIRVGVDAYTLKVDSIEAQWLKAKIQEAVSV